MNKSENKPISVKKIAIYLGKILVLAVIYHLGARVGLRMAYIQPNTSPVWPPTGIALAALLVFGIDLWPGIALGVALSSILPVGTQVLPWNIGLGLAIGNTLEAVTGAYCLERLFQFRKSLEGIRDVVSLAGIAMVSTAISATVGISTLMLTGNADWQFFGTIWLTWWIGDLLGALVVTPLLLVWLSPPTLTHTRRRFLEAGVLLLLLILITAFVFLNEPFIGIADQALIYVIFPFIIWAALRFEQRGATSTIFLVSGIAIWGTSIGLGPFSRESLNDSLVLLQTFTAVLSLTSLILAAATLERHRAADDLKHKINDLDALNNASRAFLGDFDRQSTYRTIFRLAVERLELDAAWMEISNGGLVDAAVVASTGIEPPDISAIKKVWHTDLWLFHPNKANPSQLNGKQQNFSPMLLNEPEKNDTQFQSYAIFPLVFGGNELGSLNLVSRSPNFFNADRVNLFQSYANLSAVAIQNTWLFDKIRAGNEQLHGLSQRLMKAQEEERLHLSRELHDESGQLLAALTVQLGLLERDLNKPASANAHVTELRRFANEIQSNLHTLAVNLRPASLDHMGLVPALQQYVNEFSQQYPIQIEFESVGLNSKRLPLEVEIALFRIVQESLTNVILHAHAKRVDLLLSLAEGRVVAVIEDDGVGFSPSEAAGMDHLGLFGMRERVGMLGGKMTIESSPGHGTLVRVEVPIND